MALYDVVLAYQLENNDILEDGRYVYSVTDDGDYLVVEVCDEEGECENLIMPPFSVVKILVADDD